MAAHEAGMDFQNLIDSFLNNRKNANPIISVLKYLQEEHADVVQCMVAVQEMFVQILKRGDFEVDPQLKVTNANAYKLEEQYVKWLTDLYNKFFDLLLGFSAHENDEIRVQAFGTIFQLVSVETRRPDGKFPVEKFEKLVRLILHSNKEAGRENLSGHLTVYLSYRDVLFFCWRAVKDVVTKESNASDDFIANLLDLLEKIKPPKDLDSMELLCYDDTEYFKQYNDEILEKNIQKTWMKMTNVNLNVANHRKLLIVLNEGYLSVLPKPTLLTDFLVGSLSIGGATSLLALQGMSTLVTKHNLECPNIFGKLYNMFQADIFYTRYKARLFYLADIFLQSTYVPEKLVAAFAKRLSRLSLSAQTPDLVLIMQFVGNILIRHPALAVMIYSDSNQYLENDPFDMDETDPVKSGAAESSLWELALLKEHVQPKVAAAAKFLDQNLPRVEWDIRDELETSYSTMFAKEVKSRADTALNHVRPAGIKNLADDRLYKMWSLT